MWGNIATTLWLVIAATFLALPASAAIFDDGNDRKLLFDLRLKPESSLTDEERMILRAADRYGNVGFCHRVAGNATLIDYFGRPAIVTSAHIFFDSKTGKPKCSDAELRSAIYMPNISYYDARGKFSDSFTKRKVKLVVPPADDNRWQENPSNWINPKNDYIIFYLEEDIRDDVMPDGHRRGALKLSVGIGSPRDSGRLAMIGTAPDIRKGLAVSYQTCRYKGMEIIGIVHDCDTVAGSSASALLVRSGDGGFVLRAIHAGDKQRGAVVPAADDHMDWNYGTDFTGNSTLDDLLAHADRPSAAPSLSPALIPYQLQFLLHRAGCYSGKLDNKWGPGSRAALDRFVAATGASLPGREPSMELWDALEAAVKEHGEACR